MDLWDAKGQKIDLAWFGEDLCQLSEGCRDPDRRYEVKGSVDDIELSTASRSLTGCSIHHGEI